MNHPASEFFQFPRTPHLAWLGEGVPRDDKLLSPVQSHELLKGEVVVEEKVDGTNLGISVAPDGALRVQSRGQYVAPPLSGEFERLGRWLAQREDVLFDGLGEELILFGEWCAARHSVVYDSLPDWFLMFDVYDRPAKRFWSTRKRDTLARRMGLNIVPRLFRGHTSLQELKSQVWSTTSQFYGGPVEGFVIRKESAEWLVARAKLVHSDFVQNIAQHWRRRAIEWNRLRTSARAAQSIER